MKIEIADMITFEGEKYITLDVMNYNNINYAFVNKLTHGEEPTKEYFIFKPKGNDDLEILTDNNLINILLPIFQKNIEKQIQEIMAESN